MTAFYQDRAVQQRLTEFLGSDLIEQATSVYLTHLDGCTFDRRSLRPPSELDWFLQRDLDIARSVADTHSLLLHLDVEYVNFDSPAEAYLNPQRAFALQEPVVAVIETLLLEWGIRPLHLITGQGHHFVWRIKLDSEVAQQLVQHSPAPELVSLCEKRLPTLLHDRISPDMQKAFSGISLVMEYLVHRVKERAAALCEIPVEITAVHVGPGTSGQREIISLDISEYGDPLASRVIRMPFTNYLKPSSRNLPSSAVPSGLPDVIHAIPLHEMNVQQALGIQRDEDAVMELARRACVRIPEQAMGTQHLLNSYLASRLRRFHQFFYSAQHEPKDRWDETYRRVPLTELPNCVQHLLEHPNDLLLKPAGMQLVSRSLLAMGWHPRHIAGLVRSKFEDPQFRWGVDWNLYEPATRADFYTRIFAGLYETGLDQLVDFNCVSTREKGFCFLRPTGCIGLEQQRHTLLTHQCK
ncbi:hypothetical protein FEM03_19705 [Phragmitibacter flavus]|uniref:Uncharacterized protein n=1 Tax=Phragmitibacter flavus TaxID=2576071 RepID=A0A5R8K9W7_9BACT|nr:hypothetical protein [Phragmitibacter flavus]TLD69094.1 hypothetical protein FEM03_19705 [Phragmitibacter flavus]